MFTLMPPEIDFKRKRPENLLGARNPGGRTGAYGTDEKSHKPVA
jgi:hypothetical protein